MLALHGEVIRYVESTVREIDFSDEAFGLADIEEAGPGGSFIDREHTARHFRKELWFPRLLDRSYYQAWQDAGALSTEDCCVRRRDDILRTHTPEPVSEDLQRTLDAIVVEARETLGG
jgi:trimethylamine--corrinoid protein Co-methyltransferase